MKKYILNNLRELSTEEQLHLDGGINSNGCTCSTTCSCNDESPKADVDKVAKAVANDLKKRLES